ncbi:MAG: FAD-dependent oxidoreductase [Clostridia bacterium]|nr:FAD-dependent oxidoreductase [Clostridia bacterium]
MQGIFLETEGFHSLGGWLIEQQSTLQMGSPYLLAHGLGVPVEDATTQFICPESGEYTVWARTRDWTAPWSAEQAGKFSIYIDGKPLPQTLGTNGKEWTWQKAGIILLDKGEHALALHDLTGFDGRCDAVYLTVGTDVPPDSGKELESFRLAYVSPQKERVETEYDLIVVGGGIAGICTALAASRSGGNVLLIHDRTVLGGCNSSEVRVCLGGRIHMPPYERLGDIVKEIQPIMGDPNLFAKEFYEDDRKRFAFMPYESKGKCTLALGEQVIAATTEAGVIQSVEALHIRSGARKYIKASCLPTARATLFLPALRAHRSCTAGKPRQRLAKVWVRKRKKIS